MLTHLLPFFHICCTAQARCRELEQQLTEAHFDREELEGQVDAQAAAARQQLAAQRAKHQQQVVALRQQVQELKGLLKGLCCAGGDKGAAKVSATAAAAVSMHPFVGVSALPEGYADAALKAVQQKSSIILRQHHKAPSTSLVSVHTAAGVSRHRDQQRALKSAHVRSHAVMD